MPSHSVPYLIESLTAPVIVKHHWIFNGPLCDFTLAPITYLEETTGPAYKARINNSEFWIPATWNILVTDRETYQLDTVGISLCASVKHEAFSFSPDEMKLRTLDVMIVDYIEEISLVHPMITKATSLVHAVGPSAPVHGKIHQLSVCIGPHDLYKHIANKVVGDVFS